MHVEQADAIEWLAKLEAESVDLIITDPAYESLEKHRAVGTTTRLTKRWFPIFPNERLPDLMDQLYRVLKKNSHCYIYCDQETAFYLKPAGETAGFKFWKPLVWDKQKIGMGYHYRARYEFILFFEKGKRKLRNLGTPDVLSVSRVRTDFPTEKPVELNRVLVRQSSNWGDLVADPFMGSGSTGVAAVESGRRVIGCDVEAQTVIDANKRIAHAYAWCDHCNEEILGTETPFEDKRGVFCSTVHADAYKGK